MKNRILWLVTALLFLSGCDKQIEDFVRGPGREPTSVYPLQAAHQKEFVAGHQDVVLGSGYRVQVSLGSVVDTIQNNSSGGYKVYHTVQGSIAGP